MLFFNILITDRGNFVNSAKIENGFIEDIKYRMILKQNTSIQNRTSGTAEYLVVTSIQIQNQRLNNFQNLTVSFVKVMRRLYLCQILLPNPHDSQRINTEGRTQEFRNPMNLDLIYKI